MIFVDASAIVAVIAREDDWHDLAIRMAVAGSISVTPVVVWETTLALTRARRLSFEEAASLVNGVLDSTDARILDITAEIGRHAVEASRRYGRGRHRAALNLGDCFAYAAAKVHDLPLLFKGDDFVHTDIAVA